MVYRRYCSSRGLAGQKVRMVHMVHMVHARVLLQVSKVNGHKRVVQNRVNFNGFAHIFS